MTDKNWCIVSWVELVNRYLLNSLNYKPLDGTTIRSDGYYLHSITSKLTNYVAYLNKSPNVTEMQKLSILRLISFYQSE